MTKEQDGRVKGKVRDIASLSSGVTPNEFLAALSMAAGVTIAQSWEPELHERCIAAHLHNVRSTIDHMSKTSCP